MVESNHAGTNEGMTPLNLDNRVFALLVYFQNDDKTLDTEMLDLMPRIVPTNDDLDMLTIGKA